MSAFLLHGCQQAHKRLATLNDATPIAAPTAASTEDVTLYLANDADASITPTTESTRPAPGAHSSAPAPCSTTFSLPIRSPPQPTHSGAASP